MVTIYAFSIENFKRSKFEVDALMEMAKVKLSQMAQHGDLLDSYGARVRVLGRLDLLKPDVLEAVNRAVEMTSRNGDRVLNICFPYTSRDEITTAVRETVSDYSKPLMPTRSSSTGPRTPFSESHIALNIKAQTLNSKGTESHSDSESTSGSSGMEEDGSGSGSGSGSGGGAGGGTGNPKQDRLNKVYENGSSFSSSTTLHLGPQDVPNAKLSTPVTNTTEAEGPAFVSPETISRQTLTDHMFTKNNPPLDMLVRTSGVERLSDFMLWQCHEETEIVFLNVMWPEFDLWHFIPVLLGWQRKISKSKQNPDAEGNFDGETPEEDTEGIVLRPSSTKVKGM